MKKIKSFSELVPKWAKKLKKGFKKAQEECVVDGKTLDMSRYTTCIVGEAYDFKKTVTPIGNRAVYENPAGKKFCGECQQFANDFDNQLSNLAYAEEGEDEAELLVCKSTFQKTKKAFVDHWNKVHIK